MASPATTTKTTTTKTEPSTTAAATPPPATDKPADKKPLTKDEMRALFATFQTADDAVTSAESALEAAKGARSATVGAIVEGFGSTGPFKYKGRELSARKTKGGAGYTFAEKTDHEVVEIG